MKVAIIGAGAMGSLYGAMLSAAEGVDVRLIDIRREHVDAINKDGLIVEDAASGAETRYAGLSAATDARTVGEADLAVVFVKSMHTGAAIRENGAVFGAETTALTLQNGLGNIEEIAAVVGEERVLAGTTSFGATMLGPGRIRYAGKGKTVIGALASASAERARRVTALFARAGMEAEISDDAVGLIWDKLLVNVGINALTAIARIENGRILECPELDDLLVAAVREAAATAAAKGVKLGFSDPAAHAREVCAATARNRSSMLQDVLCGRPTEIDRINGAIAKEAAALGLAAPVNETLTKLVKYFERR
jgi:2-dehydropantoate 2-reductase